MANLIRSASLTGFAALARSFGLDPEALAAEVGLPIASLYNPDLRIDAKAVGQVLELAADRARIQNLGLQLAEARALSNLGPVGIIVRDQPTLRKAIEVLQQYLWLHNEALSLLLEEADDIAILRLDVVGAGGRIPRQGVELAVGVACLSLRALLGPGWRPEAILFRHERPVDVSVHRRVFAVAPEFLQDLDGLVIARKDLDAAIPAADPAMARQIASYVEHLTLSRTRAARDIAGEAIVLLLPLGHCTAERVASHMSLCRRTLHRRLAQEGVAFQELLDERRGALVLSLLASGRSLGSIADLAGFSSPSALSRWFRRQFGNSPSAYRAKLAAE